MTTPLLWLQAHRDHILSDLIDFVRIPSVSTDPAYAPHVREAAQWVARQMALAGPLNPRVIETAHHPIVYGEWLGVAGAPTILVYGHYDVQPPDPLEKWTSAPFEPQVREGRLYARGVSDDKGPMLIPIKVAQAFFSTRSALPVNVKFVFEGEEEDGSVSLEQFIAANADLLAADFVLSADGAMWRIDEPSITVASRGLAGLEFTLTGAAKDLHSGRYGGAVANPLHAIARLIASLHTPDGRVAVAGFYDAVDDTPPVERAAVAALDHSDARFLEQVSAPDIVGEPGYSTLERLWLRPTLEVNGLWGGYQGVGGKTIVPSEAHAKITCRLVPRQHPLDIQHKVAAHLEAHVPRGTRITIHLDEHGAFPYRIAPDHIGLRIAEQALMAVYGKPPLFVRMGGTIPVSEFFKRVLNLDTVFFSFSTADEDYHAPNEFFRIHRLHEGLDAWVRFWTLLGEVRQL